MEIKLHCALYSKIGHNFLKHMSKKLIMYTHSHYSCQRVNPRKYWDQLCFELFCCTITIELVFKREREMKRETDSWRGFFIKACLVKHSYYESINPHYDTLLFHSFTTCCQSSSGNITVPQFKSHIQYLLFFQLQLDRNVNKPYKPYRALTPCHCTAGFILACVRQHMRRGWNSSSFLFIHLFI